MAVEFMDILQGVGSISGIVLFPIWRSLNRLGERQEKTNIILARDYVTKTECRHTHETLHKDLTRLHERMDEIV